MTTDELIQDVIKRLHDPSGSASDVAEAVKAVASNDGYIAFITYNIIQLLTRLGAGSESEVRQLLYTRMNQDKTVEQYFRSPYLATVAIGFELGKRK